MHTNRLANETSPYLLQHAHNPVDWYPWGDEALERAKKEDKPIFLSIGYSTCYWCHVMERESFENEEVAKVMNEHFVCIKVDREERPDLDEIYMTAVQVTSGHGGWPMSVFLTPDRKPFFAATYFPREQFVRVLQELARLWKSDRQRLLTAAQSIADAVRENLNLRAPATGDLDDNVLSSAVKSFEKEFDEKYGGFGGAPKFPPHQALAFLMERYRRTKDDLTLRMINVTLDQMARGGDYDQIGGGFHRYSTDARWLVPHFEKMLYDNAQLASIYAEISAMTGNEYFRRIADEVYTFVLREMTSPEGAFYSALDAESLLEKGGKEKEEGAYYVFAPAQVKEVLGEEDGELFCKVYDITASGNFEGKSIPNLLVKSVNERAAELHLKPDDLWKRLDTMRAKLLRARTDRPYPHLDDKVLTAWNALMISSFARGYKHLKDGKYLDAARKASEFLLATMRDKDGRLLRTYRAGKAKLNGYLDDYAFLSVALLDLYEVTKDERWLKEAEAIVAKMVDLFWDSENKGFFFTSIDHPDELIARSKSTFDGAEPSGNSMAAIAMLRLGGLIGRNDLVEKAREILQVNGALIMRAPQAAAMMLVALESSLQRGGRDRLPVTESVKGEDVVRVKVDPERIVFKNGQRAEVNVRLTIKDGWHINSNRPTLDYLVATKLELSSDLPVKLDDVRYPKGKRVRLGVAGDELDVYEDDVTIGVSIGVVNGKEAGASGDVVLKLTFQACNDQLCLRPSRMELKLPVTVGR